MEFQHYFIARFVVSLDCKAFDDEYEQVSTRSSGRRNGVTVFPFPGILVAEPSSHPVSKS